MKSPPRIPYGTLILVAANILAAFAALLDPSLSERLGFLASNPSVMTAAASLFLHVNVMHLLGNMIFLAAVGPFVESALRLTRFVILYFVGGFTGVLLHWLIMRRVETDVALVGASACVSACLGYVAVRYLSTKVPFAPGVALPVWSVAILWVLLQALGMVIRLGEPLGGTAFWSHLGGFLAGLLLSAVFGAPRVVSLEYGRGAISQMQDRSPAAAALAAQAHLDKHPEDAHALWELAQAYHDQGQIQHEIESYLLLLEVLRESERPPVYQKLAAAGGLSQIPSRDRSLAAERLKGTEPALAGLLLESVVEGRPDDPQRPDALLALASLMQNQHQERFNQLVDELSHQFPLHPATQLARMRGLLR